MVSFRPLLKPLINDDRVAKLFVWEGPNSWYLFSIKDLITDLADIQDGKDVALSHSTNFLRAASQAGMGKAMISVGYQVLRTQVASGRNAAPLDIELNANRGLKAFSSIPNVSLITAPVLDLIAQVFVQEHVQVAQGQVVREQQLVVSSEAVKELQPSRIVVDVTDNHVDIEPEPLASRRLSVVVEEDSKSYTDSAHRGRFRASLVNSPRGVFIVDVQADSRGNKICPNAGCTSTFADSDTMLNHLVGKITGMKQPLCTLCPEQTTFDPMLKFVELRKRVKAHMRRHFVPELPCGKCDEVFKTTADVISHQYRMHDRQSNKTNANIFTRVPPPKQTQASVFTRAPPSKQTQISHFTPAPPPSQTQAIPYHADDTLACVCGDLIKVCKCICITKQNSRS